MPRDPFEAVWKTQSGVLKVLSDALLPLGLGRYSGGTGNKTFIENVDLDTGFWRRETGRVRWIFHVVPDVDGFRVELPAKPGAADLPGGTNTTGHPPKALLTYLAVVLFQKAGGSFEWPSGWQWLVYFTLENEIQPNTSAKVDKVHPARGTLRAMGTEISFSDWGVLGIMEPGTTHTGSAFSRPLTYAEVGRALADCIGGLTPA